MIHPSTVTANVVGFAEMSRSLPLPTQSQTTRLQVIVPTTFATTIGRLARLQGRSRSAVARDFLVEIEPVLVRVANLLEAAQATDNAGRRRIVGTLEAVQTQLETAAVAGLDALSGPKDRKRSKSVKRPLPPKQ